MVLLLGNPRPTGTAMEIRCGRCHRSLSSGFARATVSPPPLPPSVGFRHSMTGLAVVSLLVVGAVWVVGEVRLAGIRQGADARIGAAQQAHEAEVQAEVAAETQQVEAEEARHRVRLSDTDFLSGAASQRKHQLEWRRRLAHEPSLAHSLIETNLLRMEQLGKDPAISARDALAEVAQLAAPPGSRVEVVQTGNQFVVKVAFRMSAMTDKETGAVTKHHTTQAMRREVEEISARVIQELFDYCGTRGIAKLQVSCNHGMRSTMVPQGATEAERRVLLARSKVVMDKLYRVSLDQSQARAFADWRRVSRSQVTERMTVEYDGFATLTIENSLLSPANQEDPSDVLKF